MPVIIQRREVGFTAEDVEEIPVLSAGETFGDDSINDVSWEEFSAHPSSLDALGSLIVAVNGDELDDSSFYYRAVNLETGEIKGFGV